MADDGARRLGLKALRCPRSGRRQRRATRAAPRGSSSPPLDEVPRRSRRRLPTPGLRGRRSPSGRRCPWGPATGARLACVPLSSFTPRTRRWFEQAFAAPTPAQVQAWPAIARGEHVLVSAPTGSGKTLAAFLWALDRLTAEGGAEGAGTRVVYVSPLKALAYDIERNLRAPLRGIGAEEVRVGIRTGDTPQRDRAAMLRKPPDILVTTPESLYLMLTSRAQEMLGGVEAVIVDEIHAVAHPKRGAHLALTLERLQERAAPRGPEPASCT
ncbi:MAG: DEAD/DEAH box helicase [Actinobacteria bacterium]|nr:MAG: DEAD/DEAH box helicase [Actinomycetota bacterium]